MSRRENLLRIMILAGGVLFLLNNILATWQFATMFGDEPSYSSWRRVPSALFLVVIVLASIFALRNNRLGCHALELIGLWIVVSAIWHFFKEWLAPSWPADIPGALPITNRIPAMIIGIAVGAFFIASVYSENRLPDRDA